jgi:nudix-type nucleoside diphosphatase (YffH/AdpP family)
MKNDKVRNLAVEILSDNWYTLKKLTYDYLTEKGEWQQQEREAYDRGNGATILLYNKQQKTVILTKQFRAPTYINGNETGMLIEACAGLLDQDNPEDCIKKEVIEETGYEVSNITKIFESYMSPGSVTEIVHFFIAEYSQDMKISKGGGLEHEQEEIQVLELPINTALQMIKSGEIKDGKTIMLLQHLRLENIL